jgi:hypothetical protein
MASSYSADLKLELMATGEKSGLWGDITNTNLNIVQQAIAGYEEVSIAGGVQTTPLVFSNGIISNGKNAVIKFTGTITGNQTVTIPDSIEKVYVIENGTVGAFSVEFKTVSGTGVTFAAADKGQKFLYSNGTNVVDIALASPPGGTDKQIQFNDNGAFGGITMGTSGQVLSTDGTTASFTDPAAGGGTSWQAVITADPANAVAGNGYFCNTTGGPFSVTLPTSPTIGDSISFIDYAGTFDTNNLTIARNGKNIQGAAADLTVSVERAGLTLVFVDDTQGWLLENK